MPAANCTSCTYCVEPVEHPEDEHLFPESWYPDGTDASHMILVPSCSACNRQLGKIEERLVRSLIMGLTPENPASHGVRERVFNGMNWLRAKGKTVDAQARDARARSGAWNRFMGRTQVVLAEEQLDVFPTRNPPQPSLIQNRVGLWVRGTGAVSFDPSDLQALGEKFARGVFRLRTGQPLPKGIPMDVRPVGWLTAQEIIERMGWPPLGKHPSFIFWGNVTTEDAVASMWFFQMWGEQVLFVSTGKLVPLTLEK